jgi:hypothetical protein
MATDSTPTLREMRVPSMIRLKTSRPSTSVPAQLIGLGAVRLLPAWSVSPKGTNEGAKMEIRTRATMTTTPAIAT